jgi:hypothetical protein
VHKERLAVEHCTLGDGRAITRANAEAVFPSLSQGQIMKILIANGQRRKALDGRCIAAKAQF